MNARKQKAIEQLAQKVLAAALKWEDELSSGKFEEAWEAACQNLQDVVISYRQKAARAK